MTPAAPPASAPRTIGVLLAAGRGTRTGTLKQLLPFRGGTIISSAFDALAAHCDPGCIVIILSTGPDADRIAASLAPRRFIRLDIPPGGEQFDSIRAGLRAAADQFNLTTPSGPAATAIKKPAASTPSAATARILLHPADHPLIPQAPVAAILANCRADLAVIPTHHGKGGHPVAIPANLVPTILAWTGTGGLRAFWLAHPESVQRVEFPDAPQLTADVDTLADYESLRDSPIRAAPKQAGP